MSAGIKVGTRVVVFLNESACEGATTIRGELVGRPRDVGDTFKVAMGQTGRLIEINPNCSSFESIEEAPPEDTT